MDYYKKYSEKILLKEITDRLIKKIKNDETKKFTIKRNSLSINFEKISIVILTLMQNGTEIRIVCDKNAYRNVKIKNAFFKIGFHTPKINNIMDFEVDEDITLKTISNRILKEDFIEKNYLAELFENSMTILLKEFDILDEVD